MPDTDNLIDKYFDGSLSPTELEKFDQLLDADKDFAEQFSLEKDVQAAILSNHQIQTKEQLQKFEEELSDKKSKPYRRRFIYTTAAASVLLMLFIWTTFLYDAPQTVQEDLFASYYEPYRNVIAPIERSDVASVQNEAFEFYENENYQEALKAFNALYELEPKADILFYKSMSLLSLKKYQEAIPILESLLSSDAELKNHAPWYLALAYLETGALGKSKNLLSLIGKQHGRYYNEKKANELLATLKSLE